MTDLIDTILTSNFALFGIVLTAFFVFFQIQYAKYSKEIIAIMFKSPDFIGFLAISTLSIVSGLVVLYKLHTIGTDLLPHIEVSDDQFRTFVDCFAKISVIGLIIQIVLLLILLFRNTFLLDIKNITVRKIQKLKHKDINKFLLIKFPLQEQLIIDTGTSKIRTYPEEEEKEIEKIRQKSLKLKKEDPFKGSLRLLEISVKDQDLDSSKEIIDAIQKKVHKTLADSDNSNYPTAVKKHIRETLINYFNLWIAETISQKSELSVTEILSINHFQDTLIKETHGSSTIQLLATKRDLLEKTWGNTFTTNSIINSYKHIYNEYIKEEKEHTEEILEIQRELAYIFDTGIDIQQVKRKSLMRITFESETPYGNLFNLISELLTRCKDKPQKNHHIALDCGYICINRLIEISTPENDFTDQAYTLLYDEFSIAEATILDSDGENSNISSFIWDAIQLLKKAEEKGLYDFAKNIFYRLFETGLLIAEEYESTVQIGNINTREELKKIIEEKYPKYGTLLFNQDIHEWETLNLNYNKNPKADQDFWNYLSNKGPYTI